METIDLSEIEFLRAEIENMDPEQGIIITDGDKKRFAIIDMEHYNMLSSLMMAMDNVSDLFDNDNGSRVEVVTSANMNLSYEEYENIKDKIIESLEKALKPDPEKMN